MPTSTRLGRRPQLSEEVADHVRTLIMSGEHRPGSFVRLDETAAALGVSVTPVREALLTLRGEGLVDLVPRRGYVVSPLSRRDVEDIFWVQAVLARRIVGRSIERYTPEGLDALEEFVDRFAAVTEAGDADAVVQTQYAIHRAINRFADSDKLARLISTVARYMPYRIYAEDPVWQEQAVANHREMLRALRERDLPAAHAVIDAQFAEGARRLVAHLEAAGVWDQPQNNSSHLDR